MNYKVIFLEQFNKYPLMLPNDFFKLIYQNSHGPHHLNPDNIKINFNNELNNLTEPPKYQLEDIGNNYTRVYLNPLWNTDERLLVLDAFIKSNLDYKPNSSLLYEEIELLKELVISNTININKELFFTELDSYLNKGPRAISHSINYKQAYNPHYVVIHNTYLHPIKNIFKVNNEEK